MSAVLSGIEVSGMLSEMKSEEDVQNTLDSQTFHGGQGLSVRTTPGTVIKRHASPYRPQTQCLLSRVTFRVVREDANF